MDNTSQIECICCDGAFSSQAEHDQHLRPYPKRVEAFFQALAGSSIDGSDRKPFGCSDCFSTFNKKSHLKQHLEEQHNMPKSAIDEICKNAPKDASKQCPHCKQSFVVGYLSRHQKICKSNQN